MAITRARRRRQSRPILPHHRPTPRRAGELTNLRSPRTLLGESAALDPSARDRSRLLQDDEREDGSESDSGGRDAGDDPAHNVPRRIPPVAGLRRDVLGHRPRGPDEGRQYERVEIRRGSSQSLSFQLVRKN
jgi:hypothetical protein